MRSRYYFPNSRQLVRPRRQRRAAAAAKFAQLRKSANVEREIGARVMVRAKRRVSHRIASLLTGEDQMAVILIGPTEAEVIFASGEKQKLD